MGPEPVLVHSESVSPDRGALHELRQRLVHARVPALGLDTWEQGVPRAWLHELLDDWRSFDNDGLQRRLDELTHLRLQVDGHSLHVVQAAGRGPNPTPLLLTHGWPGSFLEHSAVLPLSSDRPRTTGTWSKRSPSWSPRCRPSVQRPASRARDHQPSCRGPVAPVDDRSAGIRPVRRAWRRSRRWGHCLARPRSSGIGHRDPSGHAWPGGAARLTDA